MCWTRCSIVAQWSIEGASDRAFYEECNRRLRRVGRGLDDCLFLTSTGRDDSDRIVRALRQTGLPVAVILDFDTLRSDSFRRILDSCLPDRAISESLMLRRDQFKQLTDCLSKEIKQQGMSALQPADAAHVRQFLDDLSAHGLFLVPQGALESWLPDLNVPSGAEAKKYWLPRVFEKMGRNADDLHYLKPAVGDVWTFLDAIAGWVAGSKATQT